MTTRRAFLAGLGSIIAAPAIVRASSLMSIKPLKEAIYWDMAAAHDETVGAVLGKSGERYLVGDIMSFSINRGGDISMMRYAGPLQMFREGKLFVTRT